MLRHTHTPKRYPEEFEVQGPTLAASNGVELELTAFGVRSFKDGAPHEELKWFRVSLRDEECYETPQTFSELDAYPEFHGSPLDDAWNEICDGHTETAMAFDDAIAAMKREFDR